MHRREAMKGLGLAALAMSTATAAEAEDITPDTVYELRVYHLNPGKLPLILERFKKETKIFERLGMHGIGYWTPVDGTIEPNTLVYMLRHKSREAARASWAAFSKDPEWVALKTETEKDGAFVKLHESTFLRLTDFSPKP